MFHLRKSAFKLDLFRLLVYLSMDRMYEDAFLNEKCYPYAMIETSQPLP